MPSEMRRLNQLSLRRPSMVTVMSAAHARSPVSRMIRSRGRNSTPRLAREMAQQRACSARPGSSLAFAVRWQYSHYGRGRAHHCVSAPNRDPTRKEDNILKLNMDILRCWRPDRCRSRPRQSPNFRRQINMLARCGRGSRFGTETQCSISAFRAPIGQLPQSGQCVPPAPAPGPCANRPTLHHEHDPGDGAGAGGSGSHIGLLPDTALVSRGKLRIRTPPDD
jgi:hypothetical protein